MDNCTFLTASGAVISGCRTFTCDNTFQSPTGEKYEGWTVYKPLSVHYGFVLHDDCYHYVLQTKKALRFDSFVPNRDRKQYDKQVCVDYGLIEKYWDQYFNFDQVHKDGEDYILESPLKNNADAVKNQSRIRKILQQFKLKVSRKGPEISASLCSNGEIRLGNDGLFWIKREGKWNQLPDEPVQVQVSWSPEYTKKMLKYRQVCESNTHPLFYQVDPKGRWITWIGEKEMISKKQLDQII
jgi:hypothetical protein